jgi:hypothetical protein
MGNQTNRNFTLDAKAIRMKVTAMPAIAIETAMATLTGDASIGMCVSVAQIYPA